MSKGWRALLVTMSVCQLPAQVEKTPCGYVTDPAFIKLRLDAGSNFTRRLDFYKKSPKAERAIWEGIRIEKGVSCGHPGRTPGCSRARSSRKRT